jgi:hypothetical protein
MPPLFANTDAFGKKREGSFFERDSEMRACLLKGCFLPEGRMSSNRPNKTLQFLRYGMFYHSKEVNLMMGKQ